MTWRLLFPTSLAGALLAAVAITLALPGGTVARACVEEPGDDCDSICIRECSGGESCCHWLHRNYDEGGGGDPPPPPPPE